MVLQSKHADIGIAGGVNEAICLKGQIIKNYKMKL